MLSLEHDDQKIQCPQCEALVWHAAAVKEQQQCPSCGIDIAPPGVGPRKYELTRFSCTVCGTRIFVREVSDGASSCPTCGAIF